MTLRTDSAAGLPAGDPFPLGANPDTRGCNFAVYSPHASQLTLCLFDATGQETDRLPMTARSGNIWHLYVPGLEPGQAYGLRADGPFEHTEQLFFTPEKLLLDPYAQALDRPAEYHPSMDTLADRSKGTADRRDSGAHMPRGLIVDHSQFDWQGDRPLHTPWTQTIIYETHIKGISMRHPDVPEEQRGTYLGMAHPAIIEHLRQLGITAVQLMPIQSFMPEGRLQTHGLTNYWGYNPINWFAPDPRYACRDAVNEFKTLVRTLHQANIEVIMDVVYNHTAEAGLTGTTLNLRGLSSRDSYRHHRASGELINDTGCGNTVNADHPIMLKMIMDSLRFWVTEYHIDGFRFDLAATLGREERHFSPRAAFFKALGQDPALSRTKLIAEPWDIGPNGYQLGQFPEQWYECNDLFRDTVRGFWRGDDGLLPDFCTRLMGSRDRLQKGEHAFSTSLNYVTYHDGFTLTDLVSYETRHNEANCEHNRDGHGHNLSANHGVEGPSSDPGIQAVRAQQKRNLLTSLLLSQGAVHLLGGDELGRTQGGNNNAYCQDNETSWYDWEARDTDTLDFLQRLIELRQGSSLFHDLVFRREEWLQGPAHNDMVHWFNTAGQIMSLDDWHNPGTKALSVLLSPARPDVHHGLADCEQVLLWLINASSNAQVLQLPQTDIEQWPVLLHTDLEAAEQAGTTVNRALELPPRSQCLLGRV